MGVAAPCAFGGCVATTTASVYTPITGVIIRSSQLVAGHGCGTGPDQVYAYVAVLADIFPLPQGGVDAASANGIVTPDGIVSNVPFQSTVVPCYADGILSNLQPPDGGTFDFQVYIYAYNYSSFPPSLACTPPRTNGNCPGDFTTATTAGLGTRDSGIPPRYPPNWTTTCTATEQQGIPVLAACGPLEPGGAGTGSDDGGGAGGQVGDGGDAGAPAGDGGGSDGGQASAGEGGAVATDAAPEE